MTLGFFLALEDSNPNHVREAFDDYLITGKAMPTPADIKERVLERENLERATQQPRTTNRAKPRYRNQDVAPWYGLSPEMFKERKDEILPSLKAHLRKLEADKGVEKAQDYLKYLTGHCKFWIEYGDVFE